MIGDYIYIYIFFFFFLVTRFGEMFLRERILPVSESLHVLFFLDYHQDKIPQTINLSQA